MRLETELARAEQAFYSIPIRTAPDAPPVTPAEVVSRKRTVRVQTQDLIDRGLLNGDPVALAHCLADTMLVAGGTYAQLGLDPSDVSDFLLGVKEVVENARGALEKALTLRDWGAVRVGCTQLQVACAGACYVLGIPYREVLLKLHERYMAGGVATRADVAQVLAAAGLEVSAEPPAANDGGA